MTKETEEKNSATSPYAVNAVKAVLRAADPDQVRAEKYRLPLEVPSVCVDDHVVAFNSLIIEGHARPEIRALVKGRPLELLDEGIDYSRLEMILSRAQKAWKEVTHKECPVTLDDLTCDGLSAAALACCAARFPMPWRKTVDAQFLGDKVNGFTLTATTALEKGGKAAFEVNLSDETRLVVIENPESTLEEALKAVKGGSERTVVVPSVNIEVENDFLKDYPAYSESSLEFTSNADPVCLASFKENVNFSMNDRGGFGVSVVTMTAGITGLFRSDKPEDDAIFIDEPFRVFVVSKLVDGTDAVIFDVVVNTVK